MFRPYPSLPDPYFGWSFYGVLVALTLAGAYVDLRKALLPKVLMFTLLGTGVVFNIVRSAWLASLGSPLWLLSTGNVWIGALDGFLFSLVGFLLTTVLFIVFWMLKLVGGGDVKLFAALGAWIGFVYAIYVMLVSVPVMVVMLMGRVLMGGLKPSAVQKRMKEAQVIQDGPGKGKVKMTYAFPVAVSVAVVLLYCYRVDLRLAERNPQPATTQVETHND
jgi:prepilin signal peptidase PulO-like enzyme (type II secretory pathway)